MDPEKKSLNFILPTKYVIPKSWSRLAKKSPSKSIYLEKLYSAYPIGSMYGIFTYIFHMLESFPHMFSTCWWK